MLKVEKQEKAQDRDHTRLKVKADIKEAERTRLQAERNQKVPALHAVRGLGGVDRWDPSSMPREAWERCLEGLGGR